MCNFARQARSYQRNTQVQSSSTLPPEGASFDASAAGQGRAISDRNYDKLPLGSGSSSRSSSISNIVTITSHLPLMPWPPNMFSSDEVTLCAMQINVTTVP